MRSRIPSSLCGYSVISWPSRSLLPLRNPYVRPASALGHSLVGCLSLATADLSGLNSVIRPFRPLPQRTTCRRPAETPF
ncbi:hypothetical protein VTK26DRAFT_1792 [Humicola hyalothermophila]